MDLSPSPVESFGADLPALLQRCAPDVHPQTLTKLVWTESTAQPYAIGVVGARLERQPRNLPEAVATVRELRRQGLRFSAGLGQIMVDNWAGLGLDEHSVFQPCRNLGAAQVLLKRCFERARRQGSPQQTALRQAFSCYYSGNFSTGYAHGYVQRVVSAPDRLGVPPLQKGVAIE
ncbi:MAG: lytic transglycosylase domain-containing protein [Leptothrix sp. (in: b-proteobacteria)]|jgi:type IV secretion system protein VirB1